MKATPKLRFVKRQKPTDWNADQSGKSGMVSTTDAIRVLQQWYEWEDDVVIIPGNERGEWRDVPLEEESPERRSERTSDEPTR